MAIRTILVSSLVVLMAVSSVSAGQQHAVNPGQLAAAVAEHSAQQDADRVAISDALSRPEVREVASKIGIDLDRVTASAMTFTGSDLERTAAAARQANQQLVGGASTVVISTTTIILILLVVILLIVALK